MSTSSTLGPRLQRGLAESLVGDITAEIMRRATCDVLIVAPNRSQRADQPGVPGSADPGNA